VGTYFKPWRQKIGVLTLVLACVFMGGWIRSRSIADVVYFRKGEGVAATFVSANNCIVWHSVDMPDKPTNGWIGFPHWQTEDPFLCTNIDVLAEFNVFDVCCYRWLGIGSFRCQTVSMDWKTTWFVYYWPIVLVLTLLSAWLLLSEPRESKAKTPVEPIHETAV
jgi:hypothetical protein